MLIVAFVAMFWVHSTYQPDPRPRRRRAAVVPPGFVPDPNYTWVPRTNVQAAQGPTTHDHHDDRRPRPRRRRRADDTTTTPTPTDDPTDDRGRSRRSGPRAADDRHDDCRRRRRSTTDADVARLPGPRDADDADSAAASRRAAGVAPLHWRAVMITLDHVTKQYKSSARPALDNVVGQDRQG